MTYLLAEKWHSYSLKWKVKPIQEFKMTGRALGSTQFCEAINDFHSILDKSMRAESHVRKKIFV